MEMEKSAGGSHATDIINDPNSNKAFCAGTTRADAGADEIKKGSTKIELFACALPDILTNSEYTSEENNSTTKSCRERITSGVCTSIMQKSCPRPKQVIAQRLNEIDKLRQSAVERGLVRIDILPCLMPDIFDNSAYTQAEIELILKGCRTKRVSKECTAEMSETCAQPLRLKKWQDDRVAILRREGRLK